jgi:hypothetical protein
MKEANRRANLNLKHIKVGQLSAAEDFVRTQDTVTVQDVGRALAIDWDAANELLLLLKDEGILGPRDMITGKRKVLKRNPSPPRDPPPPSLQEPTARHTGTAQSLEARWQQLIDERDHWQKLAKALNHSVDEKTQAIVELTHASNEKTQKLTVQAGEISELKQTLTAQAKKISDLQRAVTGLQNEPKPNVSQGDNKFAEAKREFARMYHPDNINSSDFDKARPPTGVPRVLGRPNKDRRKRKMSRVTHDELCQMMLDLIENTRTFSRKITRIGPLQPRRDMDRYSTAMCNPVTLECGHI